MFVNLCEMGMMGGYDMVVCYDWLVDLSVLVV